MHELHIFTDGSVNGQTGIGYGACFFVTDLNASLDQPEKMVQVRRFEQTSSTRLELQMFLWALKEIALPATKQNNNANVAIIMYTDSQNIVGLPSRRERLERNNYLSGKNKRLNNSELYKEYYRLTLEIKFTVVKVEGHKPGATKTTIDSLFSLVDKASRNALRGNS